MMSIHIHILHDYSEVITRLALMKGYCYITVDDKMKPVVHPHCKVPDSIFGPLKEKFQQLGKMGVIQRIGRPTLWFNSLLIVEKHDALLILQPFWSFLSTCLIHDRPSSIGYIGWFFVRWTISPFVDPNFSYSICHELLILPFPLIQCNETVLSLHL